MEMFSTQVISSSLWVNTFLFHEKRKVNIKTFWKLIHAILWNMKPSAKADKLTHVRVTCSKIFARKKHVKEEI